ncbi:hypothetical protein HMPREF3038_01324 [Akkermansia sp. KLE1797]|nr:hypothetical protein HMPREF3038_01324 [Akkermansia sp. KLE1797]KXU55500.1 hypothetical protein HMPREF3039_00231 [Akkermansia sp. KLE1798]KZA03556.1 hypothetical protein HMPREF1326_02788 [Akkermansia sp. KLE1605]
MEHLFGNPALVPVFRLAEIPVVPGFVLPVLLSNDKSLAPGNNDGIRELALVPFDYLILRVRIVRLGSFFRKNRAAAALFTA